jgi:two-component system, OmpR family, response regulator
VASVLFVDDEPLILRFVTRELTSLGLDASSESDSRVALRRILDERFDLLLIDLMMPGLDGVALLRRTLEALPDQRVIVLSALSDVQSRVRCLELGAVDYLPKPFALEELAARVRVQLRTQRVTSGTVRRLGRLRLDIERRTVDRGTGSVALSDREVDVMRTLMDHGGRVCSRAHLLREVWSDARADANALEACIRRLRIKLGADAIETVRNVGYRLPHA